MFSDGVLNDDSFPLCEKFLSECVSSNFSIPAVAMDIMQFLIDNLETLCYKTNLLFRFFPNILKVSSFSMFFLIIFLVMVLNYYFEIL